MRNLRLLILTLVFSVGLISCSTSKSHLNNSENYSKKNVKRKIVFNAELTLSVKNTDTTNYNIQKIAKKYNGYVNKIGTHQTIIRVKSDNLNNALKEIEILGTIQDKNIIGKDVTEQYTDLKLNKAENVEATLKVENELERLNQTIELLKGKIHRLKHLSEFSTITINIKKEKKLGILGYVGVGLYRSVKWLFIRN